MCVCVCVCVCVWRLHIIIWVFQILKNLFTCFIYFKDNFGLWKWIKLIKKQDKLFLKTVIYCMLNAILSSHLVAFACLKTSGGIYLAVNMLPSINQTSFSSNVFFSLPFWMCFFFNIRIFNNDTYSSSYKRGSYIC